MELELLAKKAKKGDQDALVKLIMLKKDEYYKLAYVYMKNKEDALDVMEDMIVILYEKIHQLEKPESFYTWSKTILVNCCKKQLKNNSRSISLDLVQEEVREYEELQQKEDQLLLEEYLSRLAEKHQEVIKLRYFLDLDNSSISQMLRIPLGTVKSRLSIGLRNLKESLGGGDYEKY